MLSRVADSIFWLSRYLERAENYARFLDVNFNLSIDLPPGMSEQWQPLLAATGDLQAYNTKYRGYKRKDAIYFLAFDTENPNAIICTVKYARENARIIRENIATDTWEGINDLYHYINNAAKRKFWKKDDPQEFFRNVKFKVQLINGIVYGAAPRVEGWHFSQIGQQLERADKTSRILDVKYHFLLPSPEEVGSPLDFLHWSALLKSVSGYNTFRRKYGKIEPASVVEYLILDKYFPRSIYYCLSSAEGCLHAVGGTGKGGYSNPAEKAIGSLRSELEFKDVNELIEYGLHEFMDDLQVRLNEISKCIYEQYFKIQPNFVPQSQNQ